MTGTTRVPALPGVRAAGPLEPAAYRALLRRARVFVTAPRREDYGVAQLEALADGCLLVTTPAPGPYAALPLARVLDPRLVGDDLAPALRAALDDPAPGYAERALQAIAPYRRDAVDAVVRDELLPRLLALIGAERPRGAQRARLRSLANCSQGSVFATSSLVSHARRAVATPQRVWISVLGPWASESMMIRTPGRGGGAGVDVVEVAAVGRGVDLEHRPGPRGRLDDAIDVDRVGSARLDLAPGRVADRVDQRMLDGGDHALGHRLAADRERRVHRAR